MAENKKSFVLYCDMIHMVRKLKKERQADLFMLILEYVNDENPEVTDEVLEPVFESIKVQLKRDLKRYENIIERNRNNGKKGGRPKKEPKKPTGLIENPKNPDEPKKADSDSVSDNNINWGVFLETFNQLTNKKLRVVEEKAKRQLKFILSSGYSKEDIVTAIENCYKDPYHIESGHKHLTPEFISRIDKFQKYVDVKKVKPLKKEEKL